MRDDFHHLLVLRARYRGRQKRKGIFVNMPLAELPSKVSMSRTRYGTKYLNENLAPLRRFLARRVGRLWNQVYAELRSVVHPKSAVQVHILQHLWQYVTPEPIYIAGRPCIRWGSGFRALDRAHDYFVDQRGVLRCPQAASRKIKRAY